MYLRTKPKIQYIIIINMPKSSKSSKSETGCVGFLYRGLVKTNHIRVFSHESNDLETIYNELTPLYGDNIQLKYVLVDGPEDFLEKFMDKLTSENEKARLGDSFCFNCQTSEASNLLKEVTDAKAAKNYPVTKKGKKDDDKDDKDDDEDEKDDKESDDEDDKKKSKSDKKKGKSEKKKAKDEDEEDNGSQSEQEDDKPKKKAKDTKDAKKAKSDKKAKESEDEKEDEEDDDDEDSGKKLKKKSDKSDKSKGKSKSK